MKDGSNKWLVYKNYQVLVLQSYLVWQEKSQGDVCLCSSHCGVYNIRKTASSLGSGSWLLMLSCYGPQQNFVVPDNLLYVSWGFFAVNLVFYNNMHKISKLNI